MPCRSRDPVTQVAATRVVPEVWQPGDEHQPEVLDAVVAILFRPVVAPNQLEQELRVGPEEPIPRLAVEGVGIATPLQLLQISLEAPDDLAGIRLGAGGVAGTRRSMLRHGRPPRPHP